MLLIVTGLQIYSPAILSQFIDAAVNGSPLSTLFQLAALFLTIAVATQVIATAETYVAENLGMAVTNQLRADVALHCLKLDLSFHNSHTPGELIERIDGDVTALSNFFSRFVVLLVGNALLVIGVLIYLAQVDLWLAAMLTVMTMVGLMLMIRLRDMAVPYWTALQQSTANLFGFLEERLTGIEDLHTNGATNYSVAQLGARSYTLLKNGQKAHAVATVTTSVPRLFFTIVTALTLLFIVNLYTSNLITLGMAYLIFRYTEMLMRPVEEINRQMQDFQRAMASIGRVQQLLETQSKIVDVGQSELSSKPENLGVKVDFDHVSFAYELGHPVLQDVTFSLKPGEVLGILGQTGSGKTTLSRLLFRLVEPTAGTISLDDEPLQALVLGNLRRQIGLVTQDVQLFGASVRNNLTFFDPSIPDTQILQTLNDVGLTAWFEVLPHGLDTMLDPQQMQLSAGEAQLLAFVRVFLTNPALIILDEASSRLDPITENHIENALNRLLAHRTAIVIAHRLATVERADTIMIIDQGRIAEYGPRLALADSPTSKFAQLLQVGLGERA